MPASPTPVAAAPPPAPVAAAPAPVAGATAPSAGPSGDPALLAERDRLTERFAVMQTELGGLFYEMAIRDHVRLDVLMPRAAALQRVDAELAHVEHLLAEGSTGIGGHCPNCGAAHARGAAYCAQCATALAV
jgi:hypothetical protein